MSPRFAIAVGLHLGRFDLDVDIESDARTLGVFGASGSGKTSLLECVTGWRRPARGRIRVEGRTMLDRDAGVDLAPEERGIGFVPQDALLFPHWSVRANLAAGRRRGARAGRDTPYLERTARMLEIDHLLERGCDALSGGERQRAALARALVSRPDCLLLDEPLGALDLPLRRRILPYLVRVRDAFALPTVLVSHDATEVQALCDEVVVLERGRVCAQGRPEDVLRERMREHFENVLRGVVVGVGAGTACVRLERGGDVHVPESGLVVGENAVVSIGSDEILVALEAPRGISARNVIAARVEGVGESEPGVRVEARLMEGRGERLVASLTEVSARELGLGVGSGVYLVFKASACRVLSGSGRQEGRAEFGG